MQINKVEMLQQNDTATWKGSFIATYKDSLGCIAVHETADDCFGKVEKFVGNFANENRPRWYEPNWYAFVRNLFHISERVAIHLFPFVVWWSKQSGCLIYMCDTFEPIHELFSTTFVF
jgi:hypothetical protein